MSALPAVADRPLLTVDELAATNLGLNRNAWYRLVAEGAVQSVKVGRRVLVTNASVRALVGLDTLPAG